MNKKLVKKVFVVDDNELTAATLEDYIASKTKHTVQTFGTGEECLEHIADERPDIIVLDYNLNSVDANAADGAQILDTIKKIDHGIHVIMLSGKGTYGTALQTISMGADTYILKDDDAFAKVVETINAID